MLSEKELRTLCAKFHIETAKANGEEYNNKEKREKLRAYHHEAGTSFHFDFEEMPATGTTRDVYKRQTFRSFSGTAFPDSSISWSIAATTSSVQFSTWPMLISR